MQHLHVMLCVRVVIKMQQLRVIRQVLREQVLALQVIVPMIINSSLFIIN